MTKKILAGALDVLTSLKTTIVCLAALMILVVACTLAQVNLGTFGAVEKYMRAFVVWHDLQGSDYRIPLMPGGALVGLVLAVNLIAAQLRRLELSWKKSGLWVVHAGLILLVAGEFVTAAYQVDARLAVEEGQTVNFIETPREMELVVTDVTGPEFDERYGVSEALLAAGGTHALPGTPLTVRVVQFFKNAELRQRSPMDGPSLATAGIGPQVAVQELAPVAKDDSINTTTAYVEILAAGRSTGVWLVSNVLGAPQSFLHEGRKYTVAMQSRRHYLPYSMTLKKFSHDVYAGTDIPKNFSSLVRLVNPKKGEDREVLIFMNQPLRYDGKAFYQASFGKGDKLSILQVVENPGWLLPYISCVLVTVGLCIHFAISLRRSSRRRLAAQEA